MQRKKLHCLPVGLKQNVTDALGRKVLHYSNITLHYSNITEQNKYDLQLLYTIVLEQTNVFLLG